MRNIVILNSLHFSYPLPILMRVSYNTLIVKQNTSDYYKYSNYCYQKIAQQPTKVNALKKTLKKCSISTDMLQRTDIIFNFKID